MNELLASPWNWNSRVGVGGRCGHRHQLSSAVFGLGFEEAATRFIQRSKNHAFTYQRSVMPMTISIDSIDSIFGCSVLDLTPTKVVC